MRKLIFALFIFTGAFSACTHEPGVILAGKGGNAIINVYPQHHGVASNMDSCVIYVKYNTLDAPADGIYDDSVICPPPMNSLELGTFSGLKNGNYYFFCRGYDYSISQRVKGGLPYTVTVQGAQNFNLPVSEN